MPQMSGNLPPDSESLQQLFDTLLQTRRANSTRNQPSPIVNQVPNNIITSTMACGEIIALLKDRGCADLTNSLDQSACSGYPVASGGLGDVFKGKLVDGTSIAIKTIRVDAQQDDLQAGTYQKRAAKEIYTWSKCRHPNVVQLLGLATFRDSLAMICKWEEDGDLKRYLPLHPNADRCRLITEICAGLSHLHKNDVVHGDLKALNVLISEHGKPMLTDFGSASFIAATLQFTKTTTGPSYSIRWAAPEVLEGESEHTKPGDVYSLGMTILEVLTGKVPFANIKNDQAVYMQVVTKKKTPARPIDVIPEASAYGNTLWTALMSCWSYDPKNRPIAERIWEVMKPLTAESLRPIEGGPKGDEAMGES